MSLESNGITEKALPDGLRELSSAAVKRQVLINEACENVTVAMQRFLRLYNGQSTDVEMIQERADWLMKECENVATLMRSVSKPYLD